MTAPLGLEETLVNTTVTGDQANPWVAALSDGGHVVVWQSADGDQTGIYAQLFDDAGMPVGSETLVNTTTANYQTTPVVTALDGGGYVVTWESFGQGPSLPTPAGWGIYGQRFDSSGAPLGPETHISTTYYAWIHAAAPLSDGGYVVTWSTEGEGDVYAQRFGADGLPIGSGFRVNTDTKDTQYYPSVAGLSGGGYVVTWTSYHQDGSSTGVFGQLFDAAGDPKGPEFRVNTYTYGYQEGPSVAALNDGGFVVAWQSEGQDRSGMGIYAQRFDATGLAQGPETRVNTYTHDWQNLANVTALSDGGYVVTWTSDGEDGSGSGVYAQRYDASGAPLGPETRINTYTLNDQEGSVAATLDGGFVVTWDSREQDGSGLGVYQKLIILPTDGPDILDGTAGPDLMSGLGGDDVLKGGPGADTLDGGSGFDTADYSGSLAAVAINLGKTSHGFASGVGGDADGDRLQGIENLVGSAFDDKLTGDNAANVLTGNDGADHLRGAGGNDVLWGGAGADKLDGGTGADTMYGGAGDDTYTVDDPGDQVIENPGEGTDTVNASVSFTLGANVEKLYLKGTADIDATGNGDANTIKGNDGDNVITGGGGKDHLTGGAGADTFVFGAADASSADKITDFEHGVDRLQFAGSDYGLPAGALDPSLLVFGPKAADHHAEFVYDAAKKTLYWDADGVGGEGQVAVASFSTAVTLTSGDFIMV
jgi:Ca2+-binding RTX toxin-like protein